MSPRDLPDGGQSFLTVFERTDRMVRLEAAYYRALRLASNPPRLLFRDAYEPHGESLYQPADPPDIAIAAIAGSEHTTSRARQTIHAALARLQLAPCVGVGIAVVGLTDRQVLLNLREQVKDDRSRIFCDPVPDAAAFVTSAQNWLWTLSAHAGGTSLVRHSTSDTQHRHSEGDEPTWFPIEPT